MPARHLQVPAAAVVVLAASVLAGGCASTQQVSVEALGRAIPQEAHQASYRLATKHAPSLPHSLRSQETERQVRTVLSSRGLYEAPAGVEPAMIVELSYGLGQPRARCETVFEPIYAPVGAPRGGTPARTGSITDDPRAQRAAQLPGASREIIGHVEHVHEVIVREKYLDITASANTPGAADQPRSEIFRVRVSIENESGDLRKHLPLLAGAALSQLGRSTDGLIALSVSETSDAVAWVKAHQPGPTPPSPRY